MCGKCGAVFDEASWARLTVSERLTAPEIRRLVVDWPDHVCVEVRVCRCGTAIAAKRPA